jgi:hypothetical protein
MTHIPPTVEEEPSPADRPPPVLEEETTMMLTSPTKKRLSVVTSSVVFDLAEDIIKTFILIDSPQQVNIPGVARIAIEESFKRWGATNHSNNNSVRDYSILNDGEDIKVTADSTKSVYTPTSPGHAAELDDETYIELFATAKKEIYELMKKDKLMKWKDTANFRDFFNNLASLNSRKNSQGSFVNSTHGTGSRRLGM